MEGFKTNKKKEEDKEIRQSFQSMFGVIHVLKGAKIASLLMVLLNEQWFKFRAPLAT